MDALEFLKAKEKMCRMHPVCIDCPVKGMDCVGFGSDATNFEKLVQVVEEWSREHPRKTRQDEFLKVFPNANLVNGLLIFCPHCIDEAFECKSSDCFKCRNNYWMQEVE